MDDNRHVINPPRPKDVPHFVTPEELGAIADHTAKAERAFELTQSTSITNASLLDDIKHDVEAAVIAMVAWEDEEFGFTWDVLDRVGRYCEFDLYVNYNSVLITAFDTSKNLEKHSSPKELVDRVILRAEAVDPEVADCLRSVWGSYLIVEGNRKEGENLIKSLIKKYPDEPRYYTSLGVSLQQIDDKKNAVKALDNALDLALDQDDLLLVELITDRLIELGAMTEEEADKLLDYEYEGFSFDDVDEDEIPLQDELVSEAMEDHSEYASLIAKHGVDAKMDGMSPMMHITMHAMVEHMLREEEFSEMRVILAKVTSLVMSRYDAIHSLAEPLAEIMYESQVKRKPFDTDVYINRIRKLIR